MTAIKCLPVIRLMSHNYHPLISVDLTGFGCITTATLQLERFFQANLKVMNEQLTHDFTFQLEAFLKLTLQIKGV